MPNQIIPVNQLDTMGFNADTPPVSLPPQAFDDARNVRFRDGAILKMEGEVNIFPQAILSDTDTESMFGIDTQVKYIAWWPNPNKVSEYQGYYLVIAQSEDTESGLQRDYAYIMEPDGTPRNVSPKGGFEPDDQGNWQHTFFQGGFCLIINNGEDVPHYILDPEGNTNIEDVPIFAQLPGWESYNVNEVVLSDTFNDSQHSRVFDLGQLVDYTQFQIAITIGTGDEYTIDTDGTVQSSTASTDTETNTTIITFADDLALNDSEVHIQLRSRDPVAVRCGVIRSFGDFLVAANLSERNDSDLQVVIRHLPGVVRTSDIAIPGAIPNNWNPFAAGTNTADEYVVTQEGIVQDMVELQGSLYIYSNSSISILRQTGNPAVPISVTSVTDSYGVQTTNGVIQFDGQHFVVGSQDIYIFGGHPGNIQSVADGRVRNYFFGRLNPLHEQRLFVIRHRQKDEIWICYPSSESITGECDEALIWNYRKNNWTRRDLYNVHSGDIGPVPGGGVPSQLIHLKGESGDNGVTNIGAIEVQSLAMEQNYTLPGDTDGHKSIYDIRVNYDGNYHSDGFPIFDLEFDESFNTGNTPFFFLAQGRDVNGLFTFNFELELPQNVTDPATIIQFFEDTEAFTDHFDIEHVDGNPREFVFDVTTAGTLEATITFGPRTLFTQDTLTRDSDLDIPQSYSVDTDTISTFNRVTTSVYIGEDRVGHYFYLNHPNDTFPAGTRVEAIPMNTLPQVMYDDTDPNVTNALSDYMYGKNRDSKTARGGITARPIKDIVPADTDSDQYMYRARENFENDTEIAFPWIPVTSGMYEVAILVPNTYDWNGEWEFLAYDAPPLIDSSASGIVHALDPSRLNLPDNIDVANAPPVLELRSGYRLYQPTDVFTNDYDNQSTILIALGRSSTATQPADEAIAEHIADIIEDSDQISFHFDSAFDSENRTRLTSRTIGKHFLEVESFVQGTATDLNEEDFEIIQIKEGQWALDSSITEDMPDALTFMPVYPAGDHMILDVPFADTDTTPLKSFNWAIENEAQSATRLTATNMIKDIVLDAFDSEQVDDLEPGWTTEQAKLPSGYTQVSSNYGIVAAIDRPDGNIAQRQIGSAFTTSITRIGNVFPEPTTIADLDSEFDFIWSRDAVEGGDTESHGVTWSAANDFRGVPVQRATPTYFAVLIYNTEANNNFEVYISQAGDIGDYNIDTQAGTNGTNLTNEQAAEKWIQDIRLANRRLTVLDRGTDGQFLMQPANYDETANFVLETAINDTQAGANRIWEWYLAGTEGADFTYADQTFSGLTLNVRSDTPFRNKLHETEFENFALASKSPTAVVQTGWSQVTADPSTDTRRPDTMTRNDTDGRIYNSEERSPLDAVFDVDRPWPRGEVNFNKYFPIFAQNTILNETWNVNKLVGADIGWSIPNFSITPRNEVIRGTDLILDSDTDANDSPIAYRSVVYRSYLPISPEFDVESIGGLALWTDGTYKPGFFEDVQYPRLLVDTYSLDVPGTVFDFDTTRLAKNTFYVSEDYKADLRTTGRFLNIFIGDQYGIIGDRYPDTEEYNGKRFSQKTPWRLSGMQVEVMKGGNR